jgi:two-component system response regulator FixJ
VVLVNNLKQHVFFVDDEPKMRELVGRTLEKAGFKVSCFARANDCLEQLRTDGCDLLVTDVKLPEMNGIELLAEVKRLAPSLQVILVTGYGDVPTAVRAMKAGAADFIEKPLERETLLSAVWLALNQADPADPILRKSLTCAEMDVLNFILEGKTNKETAHLLHRSVSTIEVHRKHIMRKLGVDNVVDLVKTATAMRLFDGQAFIRNSKSK